MNAESRLGRSAAHVIESCTTAVDVAILVHNLAESCKYMMQALIPRLASWPVWELLAAGDMRRKWDWCSLAFGCCGLLGVDGLQRGGMVRVPTLFLYLDRLVLVP